MGVDCTYIHSQQHYFTRQEPPFETLLRNLVWEVECGGSLPPPAVRKEAAVSLHDARILDNPLLGELMISYDCGGE